MKTILITLALFLTQLSFGQLQSKEVIEKHITVMMDDIRAKGFVELKKGLIINDENSKVILKELSKYNNNPLKKIRHRKMMMEYAIAKQSSSQEIIEKIVEKLVLYCFDKEPLIWQQAGRLLLTFLSSDFSDDAKFLIKKLIMKDEVPRDFILLGGIVGHKDEIKKLKEKYKNDNLEKSSLWYGKTIWACQLALARIGNGLEIDTVISKVLAEPKPVLRVGRLLKYLEYIRQPEAIEAIKGVLFSEERLPSVRENGNGTKQAQYALGLLAKSIGNFPIEYKGVGYTEEQLKIARQWMKEKSDYQIIR